ncbi:MAG: HAD family phosphatase [Clostridia bacterium]|nr:HAD family phosphatase [Clostridia bacterium]
MTDIKQLFDQKQVFIFDFDGTLVDSMGMWGRVDMTIAERHGATVPPNFLDMLVPMSEEESAQCFLDHGCHGTVESIMQEINELANAEYANSIELKAGARELLERLRERGVKLGLLTAATLERILPCLERHGLLGYFSLILTCDAVGLPKNDPAIYKKALALLGVAAEQTLFFDDNVTAVATAKQAGLATVGVYDEHAAHRWEEMKRTADVTVVSFEELL